MINELLRIFSNYSRSLEVLYLLNDLKKIIRLDANDIELKKIKDFCDKENLYLQVSDFKLIKITDKGKGGYSNIVKKVPLNYPVDGLYHVYISKDNNRPKFLKILEDKNDDESIGKILEYPKCCIDFFIKKKELQIKIQNDYILPSLNNSNGFTFSYYINYAIRYFDISLLSHFPHNFHCPESINIAKNNLELIKKISKDLASKFENMLKSPILYTENDGIFIFQNFNFNNNILEFDKLISTVNNDLFNVLNDNKKIEVIDKNMIKIKNEIIEDVGFMMFTDYIQ